MGNERGEIMSKDFNRMEILEDKLGIEIVSYGLAPNTNGYCFEIMEENSWGKASENERKELNLLCDTAKEGFLGGKL